MKHFLTRRYFLVLVALVGFGWGAARAAVPAPNPVPVWGRKSVLPYFLFTPDLAERLRRENGLTPAQFQTLYTVAQYEAAQLSALEGNSREVMQNVALSEAEKRAWVESSAYNQKVAGALATSQAALQTGLGEAAYTRLVAWIERQWAVEKAQHGLAGQSQAPQGARSYKVYATRFEAGGDQVALPDKCLKIANGGYPACEVGGYSPGANYAVRLEYTSSMRVTVAESGPWNVDDNFWSSPSDPQPRRMFDDLPLGMPESQAAYFDDFNGGQDQFGRQVTSPVAIDLTDSVSDKIGLGRQNDWITVTYLWTDDWGDGSGEVITLDRANNPHPDFSNDTCNSNWYRIDGYNGNAAFLTLNAASKSDSTNWAEWRPDLPAAGRYRVLAYVPDHDPITWPCSGVKISSDTFNARYTIEHSGGKDTVEVSQRPLSYVWADLGTYDFEAGSSGGVTLTDITGETGQKYTLSFSAVRFIADTPPPTATPEPTATPTPTPTPPPDPVVWTGSGALAPGDTLTLPVGLNSSAVGGLGAITLDLAYNPAVVAITTCRANPDGVFTQAQCDLNFNHDGTDPDLVRLQLASAAGVTTDARLALVGVKATGAEGQFSSLKVSPVSASTPGGAPLQVLGSSGLVCIGPCSRFHLFPLIWNALLFGP